MEAGENNKPPLFSAWWKWYALLIAALLFQIVLYYWITTSFA